MIETKISDDPVQPSVKSAVEPEVIQVFENTKKSFLVDIPRLVLVTEQVIGYSQDVIVVGLYKQCECIAITFLGTANEVRLIKRCHCPCYWDCHFPHFDTLEYSL